MITRLASQYDSRYIINSRYITFKLIKAPYITRIVGTILFFLRSEFFIAGTFAKRRTDNSPSEFHCYIHARTVCASERIIHGIDFFSFSWKALPADRRYFTLDRSVSKTDRNALGKYREESRKIARRIRHAICRNENYIYSWHVIKIMSVARGPDRFENHRVVQKLTHSWHSVHSPRR